MAGKKEPEKYGNAKFPWFLFSLGILFALFGLFFFALLWRKRDKKETIAIKLEKMGYKRAENEDLKLETKAKDKIFTKRDSLKEMEKFLKFAKWRYNLEKKDKFKSEWNKHLEDWKKWKKWSKNKK